MRSRRLLLLTLFVSAAAWAGPVGAPTPAAAIGDQDELAIAYGAGELVAVWKDRLDQTGSILAIRAARLDLTGKPIDAIPAAVGSGMFAKGPAVAFDGTRFLIVWVQTDANGMLENVHGAYLDPANGKTTADFLIGSGPSTQDFASVAAGMTQAGVGVSLVAWNDDAGGGQNHVHGALLDDQGNFIKSDFAISVNGTVNELALLAPTVTWSGSGFAAAWAEWSDTNHTTSAVFARGVAPDGTMWAQPAQLSASGGSLQQTQFVAAASGSSQYLVVWLDFRGGGPALYGRLIAFDGTPAASDYLVLTPALGTALKHPQLEFASGSFVVAWESSQSFVPLIAATRLDEATGMNLDGAPVSLEAPLAALPNGRRRATATDGTALWLGWTYLGAGEGAVTGDDGLVMKLDPTQKLVAPGSKMASLETANLQRAPSVASNGTVALAVWEDDRDMDDHGPDENIYGAWIDPLLGVTSVFPICTAPGNQFMPTVAAAPTGTDFLVVWTDGRGADLDLYASRIPALGKPNNTDGVALITAPMAQLAPSLVAGSTDWLLSWEDWQLVDNTKSNPLPQVLAALVSGTNLSLGTVQAVTTGTGAPEMTACQPSAAWDGSRFFVAIEVPCIESLDPGTIAQGLGDLYGYWLSPQGVLDGKQVTLAKTLGVPETAPHAVGAGTGVAVVWRESGVVAMTPFDVVRAALVADDQTVLAVGPVALSPPASAGLRQAPSVTSFASTGGSLLFSWAGSSPDGLFTVVTDGELKPRTVASALPGLPLYIAPDPRQGRPPQVGSLATDSGLGVAANLLTTPPPAAASFADGSAVLAYGGVQPGVSMDLPRLELVQVALKPNGDPCGRAGECLAGFCTHTGVCCNTPCDVACETCSPEGCVVKPDTDQRCPAVDCSPLSSACRQYSSLAAGQCVGFGQCAEPDLAQCVSFTPLDGNACGPAACAGAAGVCRGGDCVCPNEVLPPPIVHPPPGCACTVGGRKSGALWWPALLVVLLIGRRRATSRC